MDTQTTKCLKRKRSFTTTDCSICLEQTNKKGIKLSCDHSFHKSCICEWIKSSCNNSCPLCRKKFIYLNRTNFKSKIYNINNMKFLNKNITIQDNEGNIIMRINKNNIKELLDYNLDFCIKKFYLQDSNILSNTKYLFKINSENISHFLRNVILFGTNKMMINVKKVYTSDDVYYYEINDDKFQNISKSQFYNVYDYFEKIFELFKQINEFILSTSKFLQIFDLSFCYSGKYQISSFQILRYLLIKYLCKLKKYSIIKVNQQLDLISKKIGNFMPSYDEKQYKNFYKEITKIVDNIENNTIEF